MFQTPILFIIYKNPEVTKVVFERIREIKPAFLYISADGSKSSNQEDLLEIEETRKVTEFIDWDCKVYRRYSNTNLGCKIGVSTAITWFFENVEQGIILEYDCLPDITFFNFCEVLLERYRDIENVFSISGNNFDFLSLNELNQIGLRDSYSYSFLSKIWGWATWRRAWNKFDISLTKFPEFESEGKIRELIKGKRNQEYWLGKIKDVYQGRNTSTWGFIWLFTLLSHKAYCITPKVNLVSNIGFGIGATHATDENSIFSKVPNSSISIIDYPELIVPDFDSDYRFSEYLYKSENKNSLRNIVKKNIPDWAINFYRKWK
ncbi:nucleotide-diphospho-sugar transferase [Cytophagaceae bacterium 50A-KIRBA]|uniref:nucleotide-diphospho-sugar transferase n=1 Tax=Aquirufa ecclesiirivi TaxID=2715124 RepID=UPI001408BF89|nr:nucleotide-diphospho-sugar transferase [Aquirufa ecclesiirivi]NHC48151.1 nucleotide-diphospho-sugar transferase [Aquirufa ecclesiirivi]